MMITKTLHIIIALWAIALACASCSQEDITVPVSKGDGQVKIVYKVAGTSLSRVPEDGWDGDWNENAITRVDLFVFNVDNTLFRHLDTEDLTIEPVADGEGYTVAGTEQLTYSEATSDKKYYMIANCPQLESETIDDFGDLQAVMINSDLNCDEKQSTFVMDAEGTFYTTEELSTLTFNLERAAVKIRLSVFGADGKTSIIDQCSFRLHNYVSDGTYVLADAEKYCIGTSQSHLNMLQYEAWNNVLQYHDDKENIDQAVFYSYPNDWFDESLLEDGIFKDPESYAKDDLIDEMKQTYIMVTYENNAYKVPVNFSIANDNDKYFEDTDVGKAEEIAYIKDIRDKYYRIKRNHIYDITVKIDMETNEVTVEKEILVNAWEDKGNMDVTFGG